MGALALMGTVYAGIVKPRDSSVSEQLIRTVGVCTRKGKRKHVSTRSRIAIIRESAKHKKLSGGDSIIDGGEVLEVVNGPAGGYMCQPHADGKRVLPTKLGRIDLVAVAADVDHGIDTPRLCGRQALGHECEMGSRPHASHSEALADAPVEWF